MRIKKLSLVISLIFLLSPLVFAVEFTLAPSYKQGETIIAKISGNFPIPLTKDNVFFYKEHTRIPMDYGIEKMQGEYYLYVSLTGKEQGNYTLALEDIQYIEGIETISDNIVKNFSITNETADFSVKPGAISSSGEFSIEIQNLKSSKVTLTVRTAVVNTSERAISIVTQEGTASSVSLSPLSGETKKIYFTSSYGSSTFQKIEFSSSNLIYEVPVYLSQASSPTETSYKMEPSELIVSIPTNTITKKTIFIYNTGTEEIKNISLSLSSSISPFTTLSQTYIEKIEPKTNVPIELSLFSPGETEVSGTLKANINNQEMLYSQLSLKFLSNYVPVNETPQTSSVKTCAELNGRVCSSSQTCDTEIVYAKDDICCLGNCIAKKGKSSTGVLIGIGILFVLAIVGFWFYKKRLKKAKKPVNLLDIAKGK